jgi:hypothetical protein
MPGSRARSQPVRDEPRSDHRLLHWPGGIEFRRFRANRRSFATVELPEEKVEAIRASRMNTQSE